MKDDKIIEIINEFQKDPNSIEIQDDHGVWGLMQIGCTLEEIIKDIGKGYKFRIKPKDKFIQWTASDWAIFCDKNIYHDDLVIPCYYIDSWNAEGLFLTYKRENIFKSYKDLLEEKYFYIGEDICKHICGKLNNNV